MQTFQPVSGEVSQGCPRCRESRQRGSQRQHIARVGGFECYPAEQPFQIQDAIEGAAQLFASDSFFYLRFNRIHPGVDLSDFNRWTQHPGTQ